MNRYSRMFLKIKWAIYLSMMVVRVMDDLVSVIITTHNRQAYCYKAIESVLNQTYKNIELIVVDDASDEKLDLSKYNGHVEYIYIRKEDSKGGNFARNTGFKHSHGTYICFLDDDDEFFGNKVEKQLDFLKKSDFKLVCCRRKFQVIDGAKIREYSENFGENTSGDYSKKILTELIGTTSTYMFAREALNSIEGPFDERMKFWQEYDLITTLSAKYEIGVIDEDLTLYRIIKKDKGRLTNNLDGWEKNYEYFYQKYKDRISELDKNSLKKLKLFKIYDGINRSISANNRVSEKKYRLEEIKVNPSVKAIVKYIMFVLNIRY